MSRAPFVMPKADTAFSRNAEIYDTTIGWRFVNPLMKKRYGVDSMPETAENVADEFHVSRADQDAFALRSHLRAVAAQANGRLAREIMPVAIARRKGDPVIVERDEHPRADTTIETLAKLPAPFRDGGSVTAGNASGVNDGAAALLIASEAALRRHGLTPIARIVGGATAGVEPRIMGFGPAPATRKLLRPARLKPIDFDVIELNEAFAAQALAVLRELGIADDAPHVNPNGGAIALGHPLGASGARLAGTAALDARSRRRGGRSRRCALASARASRWRSKPSDPRTLWEESMIETDVLIIGTGPSGGAAAALLASYGVKPLVVTKWNWTCRTPRAHITNQRAMEVFRDLGIEDEVNEKRTVQQSMGNNVFCTSLAGEELGRLLTWGTHPQRKADYTLASPTTICDVPQNLLEPILVGAAASRGATVMFNWEYQGLVQDADGVTVEVKDYVAKTTYQIRAKYVIGADGGRSKVAEDIGLPMEGKMGVAGR